MAIEGGVRMFSQILGKPLNNYDISVYEHYAPESILDYHHHSTLEVSLDTYWQLKKMYEDPENENENIGLWIHLFDEAIGARDNLAALQQSPRDFRSGPYYYPLTNTTIYFTPDAPPEAPVNHEDIRFLRSLAEPPAPNDRVMKYYQNLRK